jgi:hypothetical protein
MADGRLAGVDRGFIGDGAAMALSFDLHSEPPNLAHSWAGYPGATIRMAARQAWSVILPARAIIWKP